MRGKLICQHVARKVHLYGLKNVNRSRLFCCLRRVQIPHSAVEVDRGSGLFKHGALSSWFLFNTWSPNLYIWFKSSPTWSCVPLLRPTVLNGWQYCILFNLKPLIRKSWCLTLSSLNLPWSSSSNTSRELLSQFSTCSGWRWFDVV